MPSLTLATLVQVSIFAANADTYAAAHHMATETGKPMVVMIGTEWCKPYQKMERTVLPQLRKHGLLKKVAFAVVNPDRERALVKKLTGGGPIPQLLMFRKTPKGWKRRKLVGGQSIHTVEKFINQGIALDDTSRKTAPGKPGG